MSKRKQHAPEFKAKVALDLPAAPSACRMPPPPASCVQIVAFANSAVFRNQPRFCTVAQATCSGVCCESEVLEPVNPHIAGQNCQSTSRREGLLQRFLQTFESHRTRNARRTPSTPWPGR